MSRIDRAKQFAPFDALKGLSEALRLKEYEHEKIIKGELSEDQAQKIFNILNDLEQNDILEIEYFNDGYYKTIKGIARLYVDDNYIIIDKTKIPLDSIHDIKK